MERAVLILLSLHLLGHLSQAQEDEVIFITGGLSSRTAATSTEVLDISSSSSPCSRTTGDLPESRYKHSMDKMGDAILICGGDDDYGSTPTSCVSSSNASGPWLHHSTTNSRRWLHSSAIADGRLHLIAGGYSGSDTMESFYEGGWTEQRLPSIFTKENFTITPGSCVVQTSHDTFIATGVGKSKRRTMQWQAGSETARFIDVMKVGRQFHACGTIVIGDRVFLVVAGGVDSDYNIIQSSEVYDLKYGEWQDIGDLVKTRVGAKIVTVRVGGSQKMIIMGGNDDNINGNNLNSVEELVLNATNVGQSTWQLSEATMKKARSGFGAVSVPKSTFCEN